MTVKEVVKLAAENLGRQDLSQMIDAQEEEVSEEVVSLLRCFNLVALDYFPLKKEETFSPVSNRVPYTAFASAPVDILGVRDGSGNDVAFEIGSSQLFFPKKHERVTVKYAYAPAQKKLEDESDFSGKISARLLSFGVAGEFCLTASRFSEAATCERRFLDALKAVNLIRRKLSMRSRRWI